MQVKWGGQSCYGGMSLSTFANELYLAQNPLSIFSVLMYRFRTPENKVDLTFTFPIFSYHVGREGTLGKMPPCSSFP